MEGYANQKYLFQYVNPNSDYFNFTLNTSTVSFPVKEIRINFSYTYDIDQLLNVIVSSDATDNNICGNLNKLSQAVGANFIYMDGFQKSNEFNYIYREPRIITRINFTFDNRNVGAVYNRSDVIIKVEFLGL
jgi:hypothetical protein